MKQINIQSGDVLRNVVNSPFEYYRARWSVLLRDRISIIGYQSDLAGNKKLDVQDELVIPLRNVKQWEILKHSIKNAGWQALEKYV